MKRPVVNISFVERAGRVAIGILGALASLFLLAAGGGVTAVVLEVLLLLASLDLLITGAVGHCPLYARLGHVPPSLRVRP